MVLWMKTASRMGECRRRRCTISRRAYWVHALIRNFFLASWKHQHWCIRSLSVSGQIKFVYCDFFIPFDVLWSCTLLYFNYLRAATSLLLATVYVFISCKKFDSTRNGQGYYVSSTSTRLQMSSNKQSEVQFVAHIMRHDLEFEWFPIIPDRIFLT